MTRITIALAALLLAGCASFKADQFGVCLLTGKGECHLRNGEAPTSPSAPTK